jgi:hypothetical protein
MTIRKALWEGIRQTNRSLYAVLIVYAANLILAVLSAVLLRSTLISAFGASLAPAKLVHDFDFTVYTDFLTRNPGRLSLIFGFILWLIILNNLLTAFLDGGVITVLRRNAERLNLQSFFAACGEFLGRFVRLLLIVVFVLFVLAIVLALVAGLAFLAAVGSGENEIQIYRAVGVAIIAFLLPFSVLILAVDYAKVITVARDERRMFRAFLHGLRFAFSQLPKVYGLFLLCLIPAVILLIGWAELSTQIVADSGLLVLGIFLIQQIVALARAWVRVASIGGQVSLFVGSGFAAPVEVKPKPILLPEVTPKDIRDWN